MNHPEPPVLLNAGQKPGPSQRGRGRSPTHGLGTLKRTLRQLGGRVLDRRTTLGRQLAAWKAELVRDLGGDVSTQQAAVIELAVRTKLLLDSIDAWLLAQPSLVNARKKALLPVVRERQQVADALARYMGQLGLERRAKDLGDIAAQFAALHAVRRTPDGPAPSSPAAEASGTTAGTDGAGRPRHGATAPSPRWTPR